MAGLSGPRHIVDNVLQSRGEGMADNLHLMAPSAESGARTADADMQSHTGTSCKPDGKIYQRWVGGTVNWLESSPSPPSLQILHCTHASLTLNWEKQCPDHVFNHKKPQFQCELCWIRWSCHFWGVLHGFPTFRAKLSPAWLEEAQSEPPSGCSGCFSKTKKGLGTGGQQQHLSGRAHQTFCPGKTKWFDMFCTLTRIQKRGFSLQWHHLNPIVAERDSAFK